MDANISIKEGNENLPMQEFNGRKYYLYTCEKYFSKGNKRLHRAVWEFYNGSIPKGYEVHHIDNITTNNGISNLELREVGKHRSEHLKDRYKRNPEQWKEFWTKGVATAPEWHRSEVGRKWHSEKSKLQWLTKEFKKHNCIQCGKEFESRHSGVTKYCHQNCKAKALRNRRKLERTGI